VKRLRRVPPRPAAAAAAAAGQQPEVAEVAAQLDQVAVRPRERGAERALRRPPLAAVQQAPSAQERAARRRVARRGARLLARRHLEQRARVPPRARIFLLADRPNRRADLREGRGVSD
jgi:hypothetical protein